MATTTITLQTNPPITVAFASDQAIDEGDLRSAFGLAPQAPFLICDANNCVVNWRKPLGYRHYFLICELPAAVLLRYTCWNSHGRIAELFANTSASVTYVDRKPTLRVNIVLTSSIVNPQYFQKSVAITASLDDHPGVNGIAFYDPLSEAKTITATNTSGYTIGGSANLGLNPTGSLTFGHTDTTQLQEARKYWETRATKDEQCNSVTWTLQHNHHAYHEDMNQLYHTNKDCFDPLSEGSITKQFSVTFRLHPDGFPLGQQRCLVLKLNVDVHAPKKEKHLMHHDEELMPMLKPLAAKFGRVARNNWWIEPAVADTSQIVLTSGQSTMLF